MTVHNSMTCPEFGQDDEAITDPDERGDVTCQTCGAVTVEEVVRAAIALAEANPDHVESAN